MFSYETRLGEAAQIPPGLRCCLGRRMGLLRVRSKVLNPRFLLYAYLGPQFQQLIRDRTIHGSTVNRIPLKEMGGFTIVLPPREEQERIVSVLGAIDDKIESNRRLAGRLEETAATLFRARFVDFVGVEDFEESEIGSVPVGWGAGAVADIGSLHRQFVKGESALPYIGLDLMPRGSTVLNDWATDDAPTGQAATFAEGDILFGKLRPYFRKVGVAPITGRCSTEILVLRPRDPHLYGVLLGHVASQAFIDHCVAVSRGTRMPRAEWSDAGAFRIAIPSVAVAREFSDLTRGVYAQIQGMTHEFRTLREIRDALLPKLISGQIRVPDTHDPEEVIGPVAEELAAATP